MSAQRFGRSVRWWLRLPVASNDPAELRAGGVGRLPLVSRATVPTVAKTAILVIDMVRDMFAPHEELARQRPFLVAAINSLTSAGREAGFPVVWIRPEYAPDLADAPLEYRRRTILSTIAGTPGTALLEDLYVAAEDQIGRAHV